MSNVRTVRDVEIDIAWSQFEIERMTENNFVDRKRQKELKDLINQLFKERASLNSSALETANG